MYYTGSIPNMFDPIDLSNLPEEVTDYAFDQFNDRIQGFEVEDEAKNIVVNESVEMDYDNQQVELHNTIITSVLRQAMIEKAMDIKREVRTGERDDYTTNEAIRIIENVYNI